MSDPSSPITGAHIHSPATKNENAPIIVNLESFGNIFESPIVGKTIIADQLITSMLDGLAYLNIHTQLFPTGEIRGQIKVNKIEDNIVKFTVNLKGRNEVPPVDASFDGEGEFILDVLTADLAWIISYGDNSSSTRSHIPGLVPIPIYAKGVP